MIDSSDLYLVQEEVVSKRDDDEQHLHANRRVPSEHHLLEQRLRIVDDLVRAATFLRNEDQIEQFEHQALAVDEHHDQSDQVDVAEGVVLVDHVRGQSRQHHQQVDNDAREDKLNGGQRNVMRVEVRLEVARRVRGRLTREAREECCVAHAQEHGRRDLTDHKQEGRPEESFLEAYSALGST